MAIQTYATVTDVQARMIDTMTETQAAICQKLLEDAAILIDQYNDAASDDAKNAVSCRMVARAMGAGDASGIPAGASQGSISALGYSQSWTMTGGTTGEVYMSKAERKMLGVGDRIGTYSPVQEMEE